MAEDAVFGLVWPSEDWVRVGGPQSADRNDFHSGECRSGDWDDCEIDCHRRAAAGAHIHDGEILPHRGSPQAAIIGTRPCRIRLSGIAVHTDLCNELAGHDSSAWCVARGVAALPREVPPPYYDPH